ncbi:MAG: 2Fe-2S iron-sulfur cluster-binding protein [Nitrospiraceae bacterium]
MKIQINNQPVEAQPGQTIFDAAKGAGIAIPGLCRSDQLSPFGSCRLCLCEVEGQGGLPAACTTPVREGMVVRTDTERLIKLRRNVVELYLSEQPDPAQVPAVLQQLARALGLRQVRYPNPRLERRRSTSRIRFSDSTTRSAFPAPVACAPARRFRGLMR